MASLLRPAVRGKVMIKWRLYPVAVPPYNAAMLRQMIISIICPAA